MFCLSGGRVLFLRDTADLQIWPCICGSNFWPLALPFWTQKCLSQVSTSMLTFTFWCSVPFAGKDCLKWIFLNVVWWRLKISWPAHYSRVKVVAQRNLACRRAADTVSVQKTYMVWGKKTQLNRKLSQSPHLTIVKDVTKAIYLDMQLWQSKELLNKSAFMLLSKIRMV